MKRETSVTSPVVEAAVPNYKVGDKVLLHSRGAGIWFPIEQRTVTSVKAGVVHIDDPDKVPFKLDGQELEPGVFRFRFYIEHVPTKKGKPCSTQKKKTTSTKPSKASSVSKTKKKSPSRRK